MPIPLFRKSGFTLILLVAFHFSIIQISYSSEKYPGKVSEIQKQADELQAKGYYDKAIPIMKEVLALKRKALGGRNAEVAQSLDLIGKLHYQAGKYREAEPFLQESLSIRMELFGSDHTETAKSLYHLAILYFRLAEAAKAGNYLNDALKIRETYGKDHPDVAETLVTLAIVQIEKGNRDKAEPLLNRALAIQEKSLGPEHPDITRTLTAFAWMHLDTVDFEKAEPYCRRALEISEKAFGPEHPYVANSLNCLGLLYSARREYDKSIEANKRALDIREKFLGPDHLDVAVSLNDLATPYFRLRKLGTVKSFFARSLSIKEKVFGSEHVYLVGVLQNLGIVYKILEDYTASQLFFERSLLINTKNYGYNHPNNATNLMYLAGISHSLGDFKKAESLYNQSLEILENTVGPENILVADVLRQMGLLYIDIGDFEKAESLLKRSLSIREKTFGPEHPEVIAMLGDLADFYSNAGNYKLAEQYYIKTSDLSEKVLGSKYKGSSKTLDNLATLSKQVSKINEETIGKQNISVAKNLYDIASLYTAVKDYKSALPLYNQAIEIYEKNLGPEHPSVATGLGQLSTLYWHMGDFEKAYSCLYRTLEIHNKIMDQVMDFTSEDQKLKFLSMNNWSLYLFLHLVNEHFSNDSLKRKEAFDVWLLRKGAVLEAQKRYQEAIFSFGDPEAARIFNGLSDVRRRISKLSFSVPEKEIDKYKQEQNDLYQQKKSLEAKLSSLSNTFTIKQKISMANSELVLNSLPPGTVLLEFAKIKMNNSETKDEKEKIGFDRYVSFVIHSGMANQISMIDIGNAEVIDNLIALYKRTLSKSDDENGKKASAISKKLYDLVFGPLRKDLGTVKEIFISPDGNLNLMPFEVLEGPDGRFLIEDYTFNYLAAGRDIIGFGKNPVKGGKYLLMGDPDFNLGSDEKMAVLKRISIKNDKGTLVANRSANLNEVTFEPLPYTKEELNAIGEIMGQKQSEIYMEKYALEEILMNKPGPEILHLATHGFFLNNQNLPSSGRGWQTADLPGTDEHPSGRTDRVINVENPLLRSGILLAGAKRSLMSGDTGKNDGIVTAEKILGLNLHGTKLVVLSACDTGLGEIESGEGVFGLRRAFTQAGAKSIVMSLWKVPDMETKEMMVQFYRNIKTGTMNRCHALRQAVLAQMKIVKQRQGYANPRYWGAFVFMGEP